MRNQHTKAINEKHLNTQKLFKYDPEIMFIRPKILNTFVKYFQFGYDFYKINNYRKAREALKSASHFNKDLLTELLLEKIKSALKMKKKIIDLI